MASHAKARKKGTYGEAGFSAGVDGADAEELFRSVFPDECEAANFAVDPRWFAIESGEAGNCVSGTDVYEMWFFSPP